MLKKLDMIFLFDLSYLDFVMIIRKIFLFLGNGYVVLFKYYLILLSRYV